MSRDSPLAGNVLYTGWRYLYRFSGDGRAVTSTRISRDMRNPAGQRQQSAGLRLRFCLSLLHARLLGQLTLPPQKGCSVHRLRSCGMLRRRKELTLCSM